MERPFSKSQQELLGVRLIEGRAPTDSDLAQLRELLTYYGAILESASERIRSDLGAKTTSRIKNTGTILEKLRRSGGSTLKSMQDLAGMRIVGGPDRGEQDETVAHVVELFESEERAPKVIDRRASPIHGYSAVHVIVFPEGVPVEVQIRTTWQHEWAEVFEKLADTIGRGIRYGEEPERLRLPPLPVRRWSPLPVDRTKRWFNAEIEGISNDDFDMRVRTTTFARLQAEYIRRWEEATSSGSAPAQVLPEPSFNLKLLREEVDRRHELHRRIDRLSRRLQGRYAGERNRPG